MFVVTFEDVRMRSGCSTLALTRASVVFLRLASSFTHSFTWFLYLVGRQVISCAFGAAARMASVWPL